MILKGSAAGQARRISAALAKAGLPRHRQTGSNYTLQVHQRGFFVSRLGTGRFIIIGWLGDQSRRDEVLATVRQLGIDIDDNWQIECERP